MNPRRPPALPCRSPGLLALLALTLALGPARSLPADALAEARAALDQQFQARLEQVAARCDQLGLTEQARASRSWAPRRDPSRQYLFLPSPQGLSDEPQETDHLVRYWRRRFLELRLEQADRLFALARRALDQQQPTLAYQWLHETLRENPDHAEARRILGYQRRGATWSVAAPEPRSAAAATPHPQFGWPRRKYWRITTEHFRITTNHSPQAGLQLGRQLEQLHAAWRQLFFDYWGSQTALTARWDHDGPLELPGEHNVVLFRNRDEYVQQLSQGQPQIGMTVGYYLDRYRTAYFYAQDETQDETPTQLPAAWGHEVAHQLFQETQLAAHGVGEHDNFWAVEGAALYMESLQPCDGGYTVGGVDAPRLQFARYHALVNQAYTPLDQLVTYGREKLQQADNIGQLYGQSAGLASFLMDGQEGRYRPALVQYLRRVYRGAADLHTLAEVTGTPHADLDGQYLAFLDVSDDDLARLAPCAQPTRLALGDHHVTDRGLGHLASRLQRLEWLDLTGAAVTDEGLACLEGARRLKQLGLERTLLTDRGLDTVASLPALEELDLSGTRITDDGLARLAGLENLTTLWLTSTAVTDEGLKHLTRLPRLQTLEVSGSRVTPAGLQQLRRTLPALRPSN